MPSPLFETLLSDMRALPDRAHLPVEELRTQSALKAGQFQPPKDVKCNPVDCGGVPGEWIEARGAANDAALLYLHGGGYYRGSINGVREMCGRISRASGIKVLAIDYRLAPENPFPAALEDALAALRWLQTQGFPLSRIAVGGDSAGGGLACATLLATRDFGAMLPAAVVCISPWTDLTQSGVSITGKAPEDPALSKAYLDRFAELYLNGQSVEDPLASPLFADLHGLPPMLIQVGTAEILLDDSVRLAEKIRAAGGRVKLEQWEDMTHVWHNNGPDLPEGNQAVENIGAYLKRNIFG